MPWPCFVTRKVCSYLEDLRPLSSAAPGCVRADHWQEQAERLVEGATIRLPGTPKFQVRALLGKAVARSIDLREFSACPHGSIVLLTVLGSLSDTIPTEMSRGTTNYDKAVKRSGRGHPHGPPS